jgi:ParB family chromosome partitioning protein
MSGKNKFGFASLETKSSEVPRRRSPGPMGAAVRDAAESLEEATEAKIEARRRNAEDARRWREAEEGGLVLVRIALDEIVADDLPRDRLELDQVAASDEMEELKASIRSRGQREPVEVYPVPGGYGLRKGWRRWTALRQLHAETGDPSFGTVVARVAPGRGGRIDDYVDMVEENVIRQDLSFAEMAQLAMTAAADARSGEDDATAMVGRLYASLHKMKRSYIRSFVHLLKALGPDLRFPRAVSRNLGVEVARLLQVGSADVDGLRTELATAEDEAAQARILAAFVDRASVAGQGSRSRERPSPSSGKFEFQLGGTKLTARRGECRIVADRDFTAIPRADLERALKAFETALADANPRLRQL